MAPTTATLYLAFFEFGPPVFIEKPFTFGLYLRIISKEKEKESNEFSKLNRNRFP